jgi:hypothetical protein
MLDPEGLFSLDALVWLQSGDRAGAFLSANQSTISRRSRDCLRRLGISLQQCAPCQPDHPMQELLQMERQLHQLYRFRGGGPLRLFANYWVRSRLLEPLPAGWLAPPSDPVRPHPDPLGLLKARIADAALLSGPEVRDLDRRTWLVVDLACLPLEILVPSSSALARERGLGSGDLENLPALTFSPIVPLAVQSAMARLYSSLTGESGPAGDSALRGQQPCIATSFTRHLWPGYVPLDITLPIPASDHLVMLAELPWEARFDALLAHLRQQVRCLQPVTPGLTPLIR